MPHHPPSSSPGSRGQFLPPSEQAAELRHIAAEWFSRRQESDWLHADERAFQTWLQADPRHEEAYQRIARTWIGLAQLSRPQLAYDSSAAVEPTSASPGRRRFALRTGPAVALGIAATAVGAGQWLFSEAPGYQTALQTTGRQSRTLELPDGSRIALNRGGELSVRFVPNRREVTLVRGEAFFEVASDSSRPFTVSHGATEVRVVGTAFNVCANSAGMAVKVRSGRVEVQPNTAGTGQARVLGPGQAVSVDAATASVRARTLTADTVGTWRTGQLVFRDTPLSEVIEELSRYRKQPVTLDDADLGHERISGYAQTSAPDAFIDALPQMLALRIDHRSDGSIHLLRR